MNFSGTAPKKSLRWPSAWAVRHGERMGDDLMGVKNNGRFTTVLTMQNEE
jgi:hypothetical protein